ncbi:RNA-directed DNA polymerase, eukaryota [Tanacetum coccineum]
MEGFENFVNEVWREAPIDNSNAMINMMNKLKYLKKKIRVWNGMRQSPKTQKHVLKQELADLEMIIDKGDASSDTLHKRAEVVKSIQEVDKLCAMEASQKAKIKWAIEGDENSKYYHDYFAIHGEDGKNGSGFKKKLGNGADTYFWEDLWHGDMVLKQRYPRLYALEVKKTVDVALNCVTPDRFPEVSTQTRWIKAVPIKVNIHAWKVRMDCLPTRLNISRRGIDIPSILCPVCGSVTESSSHLFFDCLVAKDNFCKICRWWEVDFMEVHTFDE